MYCAHCKSRIPGEALFCPVCGRPVKPREAPAQAGRAQTASVRTSGKKKNAAQKWLPAALVLLVIALAVGIGLRLVTKQQREPAAATEQAPAQVPDAYAASDALMAAVGERTSISVVSQDESSATLQIVAPDLRSLIAACPAGDADALTPQLTAMLRAGEYTSIEKTVTVPAVTVDGQLQIEYTKEYLDAVSGGVLSLMDALLEGREP